MNLKTRTRTISRLIRWYLSTEGKKEKLHTKIKKSELVEFDSKGKAIEKSRIALYEPDSKAIGAYYITPGLHPLGVDHPQFKDLCAMLCSLGYMVYAPFVEDYRNLYITKETLSDYKSSFDRSLKDVRAKNFNFKMNIFSISFGTLMSLRLASDLERQKSINSVIVFGGFGSWRGTCDHVIEKALFGKKEQGYGDIRSLPVIFNHLIEYSKIVINADEQAELRKLWHTYIKETWLNEAYLDRAKCLEFASSISKSLSAKMKSFFLKGCGLEEGTFQLYESLMINAKLDHLDPLKEAYQVSSAVYLLHGKNDKLIDSSQVKVISRALPRRVVKRQVLTKLYAHSKRAEEGSVFSKFFTTIPEIKNVFSLILTLSVPNPSSKKSSVYK